MQRISVIHYGEIALKGQNRVFFERQLVKNIKRALATHHYTKVERLRGRLILYLAAQASEATVQTALQQVFGITHFGFGVISSRDLDIIKRDGWDLLRSCSFDSFRVDTRRADKKYPLNSMQVNREVGGHLKELCGKPVDLSAADAALHIEITDTGVFLYVGKIPGLRGLPVGVSERAVSLLSSGIDSPVASHMMMKRGVNLVYAHFHSQPFTSPDSQENAEKLVETLTRFQYASKAYFIPFIDIQKEIMANSPAKFRVLLYRRYMVRLSERIARQEKARALVTGENVAQVASQTLSNIRVVGEVTQLPILRPLAGFDKDEIVQLARRIGTYEISTAPDEDCCSLFVPDNPATKAQPHWLTEAETGLSMDALLEDAMARAEIKTFKHTAA